MLYADKRCMSKIPVSLCMQDNSTLHAFLSSTHFFSKSIFSKSFFGNTNRVSISLDPDQAQHVGYNLLQKVISR